MKIQVLIFSIISLLISGCISEVTPSQDNIPSALSPEWFQDKWNQQTGESGQTSESANETSDSAHKEPTAVGRHSNSTSTSTQSRTSSSGGDTSPETSTNSSTPRTREEDNNNETTEQNTPCEPDWSKVEKFMNQSFFEHIVTRPFTMKFSSPNSALLASFNLQENYTWIRHHGPQGSLWLEADTYNTTFQQENAYYVYRDYRGEPNSHASLTATAYFHPDNTEIFTPLVNENPSTATCSKLGSRYVWHFENPGQWTLDYAPEIDSVLHYQLNQEIEFFLAPFTTYHPSGVDRDKIPLTWNLNTTESVDGHHEDDRYRVIEIKEVPIHVKWSEINLIIYGDNPLYPFADGVAYNLGETPYHQFGERHYYALTDDGDGLVTMGDKVEWVLPYGIEVTYHDLWAQMNVVPY